MYSPFRIRLASALIASLLLVSATPGSSRTLRICADPNNLPYSNERQQGFENRIAELLAMDLGAELEYVWWAQRHRYIRDTINAGACDVMVGVPQKIERLLTTRPYYRSGYVFVTQRGRALDVVSLDDPRLRRLRVGVQLVTDEASSPPAHALAERGIVNNVRGFLVNGDYGTPAPTAPIVEAVARNEIDIAAVWGPQAGYFARQQPVALSLVPIEPEFDTPARPMAFDISVGVRRGEEVLRGELEDALTRHRDDIDRILEEFGIPRLDRAQAPSGGGG